MIYKNCSLYCNTFKQATFPSMKFSYVSPVNIEHIKNTSYFLPEFLETVYHLIASTRQVFEKTRLKHFLMQPRVFNTWGFVQIFYSRKFASLVTMARWRKDYTAEKKHRGKASKKQRQHLPRWRKYIWILCIKELLFRKLSLSAMPKTKELNHTA